MGFQDSYRRALEAELEAKGETLEGWLAQQGMTVAVWEERRFRQMMSRIQDMIDDPVYAGLTLKSGAK